MNDKTIRAWLDRANAMTLGGPTGWVIKRDDLVALLGECTHLVTASVVPLTYDADTTTFQIRLGLTFSRSELEQS